MRDEMRSMTAQREQSKQLSEKRVKADQLLEGLKKRKDIVGDKFEESVAKAPEKMRNLAIMLDNFEDHVGTLSEAQISSSFSGALPSQVMQIVRLGYPNSVRGDIFHEWAMQAENDRIYYWSPKYETTKRDGVAGTTTHETATNRYSSEIEQDVISASVGATNFTGTTSIVPIRPYKVVVLIDGYPAGNDNGSGTFTGAIPANLGYTASTVTGTINYTTGAYDVTFSVQPTGANFTLEFLYDGEVEANYDEQGSIVWELTNKEFKADFHSLGTSWSLKSELLLSRSMNIDIEADMINGASQELKKSLDFRAIKLGYNVSKGNAVTTFNADHASAGSDSVVDHAQAVLNAIMRMGNSIYADLQRGQINRIVAGADAVAYLMYHKKWTDSGVMPAVGAFKAGELNGIPVFQAPSAIVPNNEILGVFNNTEAADYALSTGVLIPVASTTGKLTFKGLYSENAVYAVEDTKVLQSSYMRRLVLENLPTG